MAPRKDKHIMINNESENSSAATKRRRIHEVMNEVPFTNPTTEILSTHLRNPPLNTTSIDLQLSPPAAIPAEEGDADDDVLSSVISQQNFLISYHMNEMQVSMEEVWRRNLSTEVKKRNEIEAKLEKKEEENRYLKKMCSLYEDKASLLEEKLQWMQRAGGGCSAPAAGTGVEEEEVESCYVARMHFQLVCLSCMNRAANMVWLPCRHLSVCWVCDKTRKHCPLCNLKKSDESYMMKP